MIITSFKVFHPKDLPFLKYLAFFAKRFDILDYRQWLCLPFAIEQFVFGEINPVVSHSINLFIYFILCCLIFYTLQRLPINKAKSIALIATILFIVHPVHAGTINNLKVEMGCSVCCLCHTCSEQLY